jgi:hypothetical protein
MMIKMIIRLFLMLLILNLSYINIFADDGSIIIMGQKVPNINFKHTEGVYEGMNVVYDDTLAYFKSNRREFLREKIRGNLEKYYIAAWEAYITNKNNLPSCITEALDNLHNKVPEIYLNFIFSSASAYFDKLNLKGKLSGEKTVWINDKMADYGGDIGGGAMVPGANTIFLVDAFSSPSKNVEYSTILRGCEYRTYLNDFDMGIPGSDFFENWERKNGYVKNPIPGLIFHELVHMALEYSTTISSRAEDEATVEDIQLKIFSNAMPIYEGKYFDYLWKYLKKSKSGAFKYFNVPNGEHWKRRDFNPPFNPSQENDLLYKKVDKKIDIILKGKVLFGHGDIVNLSANVDGSNTDDVKCDPMKKYCIPYKICCDRQCAPKPPEEEDMGPRDHGDDLFSYSDAVIKEYNLAPEAVIYTNGYYQEAIKLYGGLKFDGNNTAQELIKSTPFLVIASNGLFGKENDSTFKERRMIFIPMVISSLPGHIRPKLLLYPAVTG